MRDALGGAAPADGGDPGAVDRSVEQRQPSEQIAQSWFAHDRLTQRDVRDERDAPRAQRAERMIHDRKMQGLQVGHVAPQMEGQYLPLTAVDELVSDEEAVEDEATIGWPFALSHNILTRGN